MSNTNFFRSTKIVATIGTATDDYENIKSLIKAGVNVFRLNFSHGNHGDHLKRITYIRGAEKELNINVAILADLQGPKFRIGEMKKDIKVIKGNNFTFDKDTKIGDFNSVYLSHEEIFESLSVGSKILMDDGKLQFEVKKITNEKIQTEVLVGGTVKSNKGVNLPDVVINTNPLTEKDLDDLKFILNQEIDWIALSFVQKLSDVEEVKKHIKDKALVIAKIEKPSALKELSQIVDACDGIMVARGDLGVELPPEKVPGIQKEIILECRQAGKPVIVATQMLESMIESPAPTRAEASDVATAVFDGADAVMLSAETAIGKFPAQTVSTMSKTISSTERYKEKHIKDFKNLIINKEDAVKSVLISVKNIAYNPNVKAVIVFSNSGKSAKLISAIRPAVKILTISPNINISRQVSLLWGVESINSRDANSWKDMMSISKEIIKRLKFIKKDDFVIITAGLPFGKAGMTNMIRLYKVGS